MNLELLDGSLPYWLRANGNDVTLLVRTLGLVPTNMKFDFHCGYVAYYHGNWRHSLTGLTLLELAEYPPLDASLERLIGYIQLLEDTAPKTIHSLIISRLRDQGKSSCPFWRNADLCITDGKLKIAVHQDARIDFSFVDDKLKMSKIN
jgi:hypothetical protein